jgi:hypothetical protein
VSGGLKGFLSDCGPGQGHALEQADEERRRRRENPEPSVDHRLLAIDTLLGELEGSLPKDVALLSGPGGERVTGGSRPDHYVVLLRRKFTSGPILCASTNVTGGMAPSEITERVMRTAAALAAYRPIGGE